MGEKDLWFELKTLDINDEVKLDFDEIEPLMKENPDKAMTYLDALFNLLSVERMKQLAKGKGLRELSINYFTVDNLKHTWQLIRSNLDCSFGEYIKAVDYCKISDLKFKRNLMSPEVKTAYEHLMEITKIWYSNNLQQKTESLVDRANEEVTATAVTKSKPTIETSVIQNAEIDDQSSQIKNDFISMLGVLQSSSKESVVNADSFGSLRQYMHVDRTIQFELKQMLTDLKKTSETGLILLCGSVGDGKSHLLSYMKDKYPELLEDVIVHNDSTESFNPNQNSLDTLEKILASFDKQEVQGKSVVIAINLGVLQNFYRRQRAANRFGTLCDFFESSGIFKRMNKSVVQEGPFKLLSFSEAQPYKLTEKGTESPFFLSILDKLTRKSEENPFYQAWINDVNEGLSSAAHENYLLLQQQVVKESIVQSLIEVMIKKKVFISTRTLYNFLYEIIVPVSNKVMINPQVEVIEMLPNLMYGHPERSPLLAAVHEVDPLKSRFESTDSLITGLVLSPSPSRFIQPLLGETYEIGAWKDVNSMYENEKQVEYTRLFIRQYELLNKNTNDISYNEFVSYLYAFYKGHEDDVGTLFSLLENVVFSWRGSPKDKFVFKDTPNNKFRMAVEINIEPEVDELTFGSSSAEEDIEYFQPSLQIGFSQNKEVFFFELDYQLYVLLKKVGNGYRPNRQEVQNSLQFSNLHDQLIKSADKTKKFILVHTETGEMLEVRKPKFSKAEYEVEKVN